MEAPMVVEQSADPVQNGEQPQLTSAEQQQLVKSQGDSAGNDILTDSLAPVAPDSTKQGPNATVHDQNNDDVKADAPRAADGTPEDLNGKASAVDAAKPREDEPVAAARSEDIAREVSEDPDSRKHQKKDKDKDRKKDRKERRRSRSRSSSRRKESRRSRSREKSRRRSRSRSRDKKRRHRSRSGSRSRDRDRRQERRRSHSRSRSRRHKSRGSRSPPRTPGRGRSSSADYGGYVPRRRHGDSPIRKAPPTNADPFYYLRQSAPVPTDPNDALKMWQEQQLRSRQLVLQQQAVSAAQAASKTQREVYVGNLAAGLVKEMELMQLFNTALSVSFPGSTAPGTEPVVTVSMHSDGRYAFVELRTPEMASAALLLSGQVQLMGQSISVGRPSGYVDPSKAAIAAQQAAAALQAFTAGDTSVVTLPNVAALPPPPKALPGPVNPMAPFGIMPGGLANPANAGLHLLPPPPATTSCLQITGMVNVDTLSDDTEYTETIADLKEECSKFGTVLAVKVPRPEPASAAAAFLGTGNYGKAYVLFADMQSAQRAKETIHGRLYAGSTLVASFVAPEASQNA